MEDVTTEQVKRALFDHQITRWPIRPCSLCGVEVAYYFNNGKVELDTNCSCVSYTTERKELTPEEFIRETFNLQTPEYRKIMWDQFLASGLIPLR